MKELTINSQKYLLAEVPSDITWHEISNNELGGFINKTLNITSQNFLSYGGKKFTYYSPDNFYLPKGRWEVLGKTSDILKDEEACKELVDSSMNMKRYFKDYIQDKFFLKKEGKTYTAADSFLSYLQSIKIDVSKEHLLIRSQ